MRTTTLTMLLALSILACNGSDRGPGPREAGSPTLPESRTLAGIDIESEDEGPWRIRRALARSGARGGDRGGVVGAARDEMTLSEGSAPPAPGGPASAPALKSRRRGGAGGSAPMRAGSTDDNAAFEEYLAFLTEWSARPGIAEQCERLDVAGRRHVRVLDQRGAPVPAASVRLVDEARDRVLWETRTYGDGRAPYYPAVAGAEPGELLVEVSAPCGRARLRWDGAGDELVVRLEGAPQPLEPVRLDALFLIDTTGSMGDEIERIKATLLRVTERLRSLEREFDLRYAAVLYRDLGDAYLTKLHPFTADIEAFDGALAAVRAGGGGDGPESLNQGLAEAVGRPAWREDAAKLIFLVADAPPHMDYEGDRPYGQSLRAALARGIRIHAVAASGLDGFGTLVFRQIAQFTRGKFIFIEYGSTQESAATHGVTGGVNSNNLDAILFEQIREEVATWGRAPAALPE